MSARPRAWRLVWAAPLLAAACAGAAVDSAHDSLPSPTESATHGAANDTASPARPRLVLPPPAAGAPNAPGPAPRARTFDAAKVNAACEGCHAEIAGEWRSSLHRDAHSSRVYQAQFAREPAPFCTGCHAPEADPAAVAPALGELGVSCVSCHVVGDRILAAPRDGSRAGGGEAARPAEEAHATTRSADFSGSFACAACHEFDIPKALAGPTPPAMQSTISEHRASAHASETCASCHMPWVTSVDGARHRSHVFSASRDEAMVRSAVTVEARVERGTLTLLLRPGKVGHAFPTGDMLRRLLLEVEIADASGAIVERAERAFGRHFGFARHPHKPPQRVLLRDDRVGASAEPVRFEVTPRQRPPGGRLRYRLRYQRVSDFAEDGTAIVDGAIALASGEAPL